jgi:hypothetical protein
MLYDMPRYFFIVAYLDREIDDPDSDRRHYKSGRRTANFNQLPDEFERMG